MYLWDVYLTEKGYVKTFGQQEVDKEFIKVHPWIPRIFYDMYGVAGWESSYMDPDYVVQFFCNDTDIEVVFFGAQQIWYNSDRYSMEIAAMRRYFNDMETNINAAIFLKNEAKKRWDWLRDINFLENDLIDWEYKVDKALRRKYK